jgi:hypothetical protein
VEAVAEKKRRGMPKPKEIFVVLDEGDEGGGISILTDGTQWILVSGNDRSYFTSLESVFKKIIHEHISRIPEEKLEFISQVRELMKRAWAECKSLSESIKAEADAVVGSVRP